MSTPNLISLPEFDAVARLATDLLLRGMNTVLVAPPGSGSSSLGLRIQRNLSSANIFYAIIDCAVQGDVTSYLAGFARQRLEHGRRFIIIIDNAATLGPDKMRTVSEQVSLVGRSKPLTVLWLGALDTRSIEESTGIDLHTESRAHICLPELSRDDLLRVYKVIAERDERIWGQWGEAILYFVLDWCGNDLALVEELVAYFYGDWTQRIYDESVAECLRNWLAESPAVSGYRERFRALPELCKV